MLFCCDACDGFNEGRNAQRIIIGCIPMIDSSKMNVLQLFRNDKGEKLTQLRGIWISFGLLANHDYFLWKLMWLRKNGLRIQIPLQWKKNEWTEKVLFIVYKGTVSYRLISSCWPKLVMNQAFFCLFCNWFNRKELYLRH